MVKHRATNRSKTRLKLSRTCKLLSLLSLSIYLRGRCVCILRICGPSFRIRWFDASRFLIINKKNGKGSKRGRIVRLRYIWFIKRKGKKRQLVPDFVRTKKIDRKRSPRFRPFFKHFAISSRRIDEKPSFFHSRCHEDRDALINGEINSCSNPIRANRSRVAADFRSARRGKLNFCLN